MSKKTIPIWIPFLAILLAACLAPIAPTPQPTGAPTPAAALSATAAPSSAPTALPGAPITVTILHTNDMHGYLEGEKLTGGDGTTFEFGGIISAIGTLVRLKRETGEAHAALWTAAISGRARSPQTAMRARRLSQR